MSPSGMQIVIPMSGRGERFRRAGYPEIKPLIPVDGRPMIAHVIEMFPRDSDFLFVCARDHLEDTELAAVLEEHAPGRTIVAIEPHKKGPVHAVLEAEEFLARERPVVVNYCDFSVDWDFADFERFVTSTGCDGCLTAYRGFHPHSLGPNLYAYMRSEGDRMLEIREKHCFTEDRMNEFASSGCYYFASGALCLETFREAVSVGLETRGEFYASSPYQLLVEQGRDVRIYELRRFLQWGTPEDLEEYQGWSHLLVRDRDWAPDPTPRPGAVLVPMAGAGRRFQEEGYQEPKPLVPVDGVPMVTRSLESLPRHERVLAVVRREHLEASELGPTLEALGQQVSLVVAEELTEGQACTCLLARDQIAPDEPLTIASCDTALVYDQERFRALTEDPGIDALAWTFRNHPHANRNPHQYGWLALDEAGWVARVSCKQALSEDVSRDPGIIGAFWFRRAGDFLEVADQLIARDLRVNGEFYVDSTLELLVEAGKRVAILDVDHYVCFGTPDDVRSYEYWAGHFRERGEGA